MPSIPEQVEARLKAIDPAYTVKHENGGYTITVIVNGQSHSATHPGELQAKAELVGRLEGKNK